MLGRIELFALGQKYYRFKDKKNKRTLLRLKELGVQVHRDGYQFVLEDEFIQAYNQAKIKSASNPKSVLNDSKTSKTEQMEKFTLQEKDEETGLFLICTCKKPYKNEKVISCECKKFKYMCRLHVSPGKTIKKVLSATNILEAKIELNILKLKISAGKVIDEAKAKSDSLVYIPLISPHQSEYSLPNQTTIIRSPNLIESISRYLNWLESEGKSKANNQEADRFLHMMLYSLEKAGYNTKEMMISEMDNNTITNIIVDFFKKENEWVYKGKLNHKCKFSPPYYNKAVGRLSCFLKKIIDWERLDMNNPFDEDFVKRKKYNINPVEFPQKYFQKLLNIITEDNGWTVMSGKRRNLYYDWLKEAYIFGLLTGGRRDVVALTTWDSVIFDEETDEPILLKVEKMKDNKQKEIDEDKYKYYWEIEIDADLKDFLLKKGLNQKRGSSEYIIAPLEPSRENVVKHSGLSNAFSHFSKLATGKKYLFKQMRKTNFTANTLKFLKGETDKLNTEHSSAKTTLRYYVDRTRIAAAS